jgi:hypothetical protein
MASSTLPRFWATYADLPAQIKVIAGKQFRLWSSDSSHPSVQFKKVGLFWSARVTDDYRALCYFKDGDYYWFWIGKHAEYERILRGKVLKGPPGSD